ncbi:MAG: ABC-F family ATP-binding cassette domain-containing protein [Clostridia bacterium]|nr:ABC-F family ATP-binding cassette domain-containing protein [Clostridia bacterium]
MIILSAKDLTKIYGGTDIILKDITFAVNQGERIGIVGPNGAGKTTLLKLIAGELKAEEGQIYLSTDTSVGYLKQKDNFDPKGTVLDEVEKSFKKFRQMEEEISRLSEEIASATDYDDPKVKSLFQNLEALQNQYDLEGGYSYKSEMVGVLDSMGFPKEDYGKEISSLSGGERTRLALACLLLNKPEILLLDEPTNHLDINTLTWLEGYLKSYKGTIIIVSHDRYFLDKTVNKIFQIENHQLEVFNGGYSSYAKERIARREAQLKAYNLQQEEIKHQEELIRRYKQRGTEKLAKRAASREKRLEKIEVLEAPDPIKAKMKISFKENFKSGSEVMEAKDLSKAFPLLDDNGKIIGQRQLFKNLNFTLRRGEKLCIVGPNGIGKTTLLKLIMEELAPSQGKIKLGHNVELGYYDQGQMLLNESNTLLEELKESYRLYTDTEMRSIMGRFLFTNDEVFNLVGDLSGGEKARLALLKLMLAGANTLLLDEPTNHLDIDSKEVFEDAIMEFPGTAIIVSHDRYLLNKVPTRILEITEEGAVEYLGKYDYYMEKKNSKPVESSEETEIKVQDSKEARQAQKEREAIERRHKRKLEELESEIDSLENTITEIENEMMLPCNVQNSAKLNELNALLMEAKESLDNKLEEWEELA